MSLSQFTENNIELLNEGINILNNIEHGMSDVYTQIPKPLFTSSVGSHFRHLLEHYQQFFRGLESGRIDYDERQRNLAIEQTPSVAIDTTHSLIKRLQDLGSQQDRLLKSYHLSSTKPQSKKFCRSSCERELLFLQSHSVHHFAIIAATLRYFNVNVDEQLGIAPSTIKHNQSLQQAG